MLVGDLRYALRQLRRSPGFTAVTVLSLALGIGSNTALFSLFHTLLLRQLPVARPQELVELLQQYPGEPRGGYWDPASYDHIRANQHVFSDVTATAFDEQMRVRREGGEVEVLVGERVRGNYFAFLGLKAALGRLPGPEDLPAAGDGNVAVVSWSYWNSRWNRNPGIVGRTLYVGDRARSVIGVAPPEYSGPRVGFRSDVWIPSVQGGAAMIARLKPGATLAQAQAEMEVVYRFTVERRAAASRDPLVRQLKVEVEPAGAGLSRARDQFGHPLRLMIAVTGFVLLLACINIAGMLLARGTGMERELAIRVSLGASRAQLMRQRLTEAFLLAGLGALAGSALAWFGTAFLVRILAGGRVHERIRLEVHPDATVLWFTLAITVLTGLLFGLVPALRAFRQAVESQLRQTGARGPHSQGRRFARALVASQVALSLLLAGGGYLFLTQLWQLRYRNLGFEPEGVLLVQLEPDRGGWTRERLAAAYRELLTKLAATPGVRAASMAGCTPIQGCGASRFILAEGHPERPETRRFTSLNWVAPGYFAALGIPLIAGRDFRLEDAGGSRVAIISQSLAAHHFPGENPIGQRIRIDRDPRNGGWYGDDKPYEVIGVVGDLKATEIREPPRRSMYFHMFQENRVQNQLVVRPASAGAPLSAGVRRVVAEILPGVPVARSTTLSEQLDAALVSERLLAALSGFFGSVGALLAGLGLYGMLAFTVARRRSEIGVRMALGADRAAIMGLVGREALSVVAAGLAVGTVLCAWLHPVAARVTGNLGADPLPLWAAGLTILAVVLLAALIPARRAASVDPMETLRAD